MFRYEMEMTPIVAEFLERQGCIVRAEMLALGNCDLVGCVFDPEAVQRRVAARRKTPIVGVAWERMGAKPDWMPIYSRLIAVELKLQCASDVIWQARQHSYWKGVESYIAMPQDCALRAKTKAIAAGVGVIAVRDHHCTVIAEPAPATDRLIDDSCDADRIAEVFWRYHRKEYVNCEFRIPQRR